MNPHAVRQLSKLVRLEAFTIVFLMETKLRVVDMERVKRKMQFTNGFEVACDVQVGRRGGLCLMWFDNMSLQFLSYSNRHINVIVKGRWRFIGIYG